MKKTLALISILILLLSAEVFAITNFSDVNSGDWYFNNLNDIADKNIIVGYPDGTFKPNNNLKFEEFIKMVVVAIDGTVAGPKQGQEWYQNYIDKALENNYILEQQKTLISQNIDRKTMAEILYNVLSGSENIIAYSDNEISYLNSKLSDLTSDDNKTLTIAGLGIICGYPDGTFKPNNNLTRSETVAVISRLINKEMRLPIEIKEVLPVPAPNENTTLENLPKVDLSNLYDYPTLLGQTVEEENSYYDKYIDGYKKIVTDDYIDFMGLMHNRDYTTINNNAEQYKKSLLYYLNGFKEYKGVEYGRLRSYSLSKTTDSGYIEYLLNTKDFIEDFFDKWVQDTIDDKVQVQAKFYTNEDLLHHADGVQAIRGILRFKYDSHNNPSNIKNELDLVQTEKQKYGQRILNLDESNYDIYINYDEIPNFEVGKWYEVEMDIVVSSQAFVHGLENKSKLNYDYIYPISVREIK